MELSFVNCDPPLPSFPLSLQDMCLLNLLLRLEEFPVDSIALLPPEIQLRLFSCLSTADRLHLEETTLLRNVTSGGLHLDMLEETTLSTGSDGCLDTNRLRESVVDTLLYGRPQCLLSLNLRTLLRSFEYSKPYLVEHQVIEHICECYPSLGPTRVVTGHQTSCLLPKRFLSFIGALEWAHESILDFVINKHRSPQLLSSQAWPLLHYCNMQSTPTSLKIDCYNFRGSMFWKEFDQAMELAVGDNRSESGTKMDLVIPFIKEFLSSVEVLELGTDSIPRDVDYLEEAMHTVPYVLMYNVLANKQPHLKHLKIYGIPKVVDWVFEIVEELLHGITPRNLPVGNIETPLTLLPTIAPPLPMSTIAPLTFPPVSMASLTLPPNVAPLNLPPMSTMAPLTFPITNVALPPNVAPLTLRATLPPNMASLCLPSSKCNSSVDHKFMFTTYTNVAPVTLPPTPYLLEGLSIFPINGGNGYAYEYMTDSYAAGIARNALTVVKHSMQNLTSMTVNDLGYCYSYDNFDIRETTDRVGMIWGDRNICVPAYRQLLSSLTELLKQPQFCQLSLGGKTPLPEGYNLIMTFLSMSANHEQSLKIEASDQRAVEEQEEIIREEEEEEEEEDDVTADVLPAKAKKMCSPIEPPSFSDRLLPESNARFKHLDLGVSSNCVYSWLFNLSELKLKKLSIKTQSITLVPAHITVQVEHVVLTTENTLFTSLKPVISPTHLEKFVTSNPVLDILEFNEPIDLHNSAPGLLPALTHCLSKLYQQGRGLKELVLNYIEFDKVDVREFFTRVRDLSHHSGTTLVLSSAYHSLFSQAQLESNLFVDLSKEFQEKKIKKIICKIPAGKGVDPTPQLSLLAETVQIHNF